MKKRLFSLFLALIFICFCGCDFDGSNSRNENNCTTQGNFDGNSPILPDDSTFSVHFIDVGQADAILVLCDGKAMLIDGGNVEDSSLLYSYLKKNQVNHLDYVISTHPHEDHVGGLSGALSYASVGVVYSSVLTYSTKAFTNFADKVAAQGKKLTVPKVGEQFTLGSAKVSILGPLKDYEEINDTSIVLRLVYGEISFLFTGDMESLAERDLVDSGAELKSTVLKVGHHGSSSSTSYRFLKAVAPQYGVISVGKDNSYEHPHQEPLSRLRDADVTLYRTDLQGDIICRSDDGKTLRFTTAKKASTDINPTESEKTESDSLASTEYSYIGNLNTKIYHTMFCSSLPFEENRIYFITKEEAAASGYTSCGKCSP